MAKIIVASRDRVEREVIFEKELMTIGRGRNNELVIEDPAVSGEHAVITLINGEVCLEDLDSTNGTKVNGQPVKTHFLKDGDVIELGRYTLRCFSNENSRTKSAAKGEGCSDGTVAPIGMLSEQTPVFSK